MKTTEIGKTTERKNYTIRLLLSLLLIVSGCLLATLGGTPGGVQYGLVERLGLAIMVAGVVSLTREIFIERFRSAEEKCPIAPTYQPGIRMLVDERQGDWRYHSWTLVTTPQELFFAGRSVLHRIEADLKVRGPQSLEDVLLRKVSEGSRVRVLFCDPTWELIPMLAQQEGQRPESLYTDLATTLGVILRLWAKLRDSQLDGQIEIAVYHEPLQYAYHHTSDLSGGNPVIYMGFYFAKRLGCRSPLFEVTDLAVQDKFENHFDAVFQRASMLLLYPPHGHGSNFNDDLLQKCRESLSKHIGAQEVQKRMG